MRRLLLLVLLALLVPTALALAAQSATTGAVTSVTQSSAVATGSVDPDGQPTTAVVEYGITTQYGTTTSAQDVGSGTGAVPVERELTGLRPATTYHYRVVGRTGTGQVVGADRTFKTAPAPAPAADTGPATNVGSTAARLGATVDPRGAATRAVFEYGPTRGYGSTTSARNLAATSGPTSIGVTLRGLEPNTTYHYRVRATSSGGETVGAGRTFSTGKPAPPTVSSRYGFSDVSAGAAVLNATIDPKNRSGRVYVEYGTSSTALRTRTAALTISGGRQGVKLLITKLRPRTRYYARPVVVTDGGVARASVRSFTTTVASSVSRLVLTPSPSPVGRTVTIQGRLAGTGAANAPIVLEATPYPFSAPFAATQTTGTTDSTGAFTLRAAFSKRTRVRVRATVNGFPLYGALAAVRVRPKVSVTVTPVRGGRVRFTGTIRPGGAYAVSVRRNGVRIKPATVTRRGGVTRYSVTTTRRKGVRYAISVRRLDRSLVTFTSRERRVG